MSDLIDVELLVKFKIKCLILKEDLEKDFNGNISECAKHIIHEEGGLWGLVEDCYDIIDVKEVNK